MNFFPELDVFLPFCLNSYFYFNFNPSKLRTSTLRIRACACPVERVGVNKRNAPTSEVRSVRDGDGGSVWFALMYVGGRKEREEVGFGFAFLSCVIMQGLLGILEFGTDLIMRV